MTIPIAHNQYIGDLRISSDFRSGLGSQWSSSDEWELSGQDIDHGDLDHQGVFAPSGGQAMCVASDIGASWTNRTISYYATALAGDGPPWQPGQLRLDVPQSPGGYIYVLSMTTAAAVVFIVPEDGYVINSVCVDGAPAAIYRYASPSGPNWPCAVSFSDSSRHTLAATFLKASWNSRPAIFAPLCLNGMVSPAGTSRVSMGGSQSYTISPLATDGRIVDVLVDGESVGAVTTYVFESVTSDHTIEAVFAPSVSISMLCGGQQATYVDPPNHQWWLDVQGMLNQFIILLSDQPDGGGNTTQLQVGRIAGPHKEQMAEWPPYYAPTSPFVNSMRLIDRGALKLSLVSNINPWDAEDYYLLIFMSISGNGSCGVSVAAQYPMWGTAVGGVVNLPCDFMPVFGGFSATPDAQGYGGRVYSATYTITQRSCLPTLPSTTPSFGTRRRPVFPLIDNSLAPHVAVNMVPPAAGTDAFNQDDEGRQWPAGVPLTPLGEEVLIGQLNNLYTGFGSNFGNNNL